jgi:hypothetical protein
VPEQSSHDLTAGLGETPADRKASQIMVDALRAHRDTASGAAAVPLEDPQLSSKIMGEARSRSQEIRDAAAKRVERPIPWWLWLLWIAAIGLFVAGWFWLK